MTKTMTKREMFEGVLTILRTFDEAAVAPYIKGIEHELALLDKRAEYKAVDSKREAEKAEVKQAIQFALLSATEPMRVKEIHAAGAGKSPQQVTALLRQMVADGIVERIEDGKVVTFALSDSE